MTIIIVMSVSHKGNQMVKPSQQFQDVKIYLLLIRVFKCLEANQVTFFGGLLAKHIAAKPQTKIIIKLSYTTTSTKFASYANIIIMPVVVVLENKFQLQNQFFSLKRAVSEILQLDFTTPPSKTTFFISKHK